jgi:hypothetical protein
MTKGLLVPSAFGDANPGAASPLAEREGEEEGESEEEEERRRESRRSPLKWGPTAEPITSSIVSPATAATAGALSWRSLRGRLASVPWRF